MYNILAVVAPSDSVLTFRRRYFCCRSLLLPLLVLLFYVGAFDYLCVSEVFHCGGRIASGQELFIRYTVRAFCEQVSINLILSPTNAVKSPIPPSILSAGQLLTDHGLPFTMHSLWLNAYGTYSFLAFPTQCGLFVLVPI